MEELKLDIDQIDDWFKYNCGQSQKRPDYFIIDNHRYMPLEKTVDSYSNTVRVRLVCVPSSLAEVDLIEKFPNAFPDITYTYAARCKTISLDHVKIGDEVVFEFTGHKDSPAIETTVLRDEVLMVTRKHVICSNAYYDREKDKWYRLLDVKDGIWYEFPPTLVAKIIEGERKDGH